VLFRVSPLSFATINNRTKAHVPRNGGSPLFQQGEGALQRSGKSFDFDSALWRRAYIPTPYIQAIVLKLGHGYAAKFAEQMWKMDEEQEWENEQKLSRKHSKLMVRQSAEAEALAWLSVDNE
jgi:hypothetical protein